MPLTKYGFSISEEDIRVTVKRLTNQLWKLIPMREHEENWEKFHEVGSDGSFCRYMPWRNFGM